VAAALRRAIAQGIHRPGDYLPPVRKLAADAGVAYLTATRAVRILRREGLVAAEPRRGYRVLPPVKGSARGRALFAFLTGSNPRDPQLWNETHKALLTGFQCLSGQQGPFVLAMRFDEMSPETVQSLRQAGIVGVAMDCDTPELIDGFRRAQIPVVLVDAFAYGAGVVGVVQDNFRGGYLAGEYLARRGHREVAWFGLSVDSIHSRERRGGAAIGLEQGGAHLAPGFDLRVPEAASGIPSDQALHAARTLLSAPGRPRAILSLWQSCTYALCTAAAELGLRMNEDFELVTWGVEENRQGLYEQRFGAGGLPPMVCWSAVRMAQLAVSQLTLLSNPGDSDHRAVRISVPVELHAQG
jgi:hypothetical protein